MEATLISSQGQSGITSKLWRNYPEQTTKQYIEIGLITSDRQKNHLWHYLTRKECGGDSRRLVGLPQVAVPEGELSNGLDAPEKCGI